MRKADSNLSTPGGLVVALARGVLVFFGTTFGAHTLAKGTTGGRLRALGDRDFTATEISGTEVPGYGTWLGETSSIDSDLLSATFNTAWMAIVAIVVGFAVGWLLALLARFRLLGKLLGLATSPITALAMPGVLLLPVLRWADNRQYLPEGPTESDAVASGSVWFIVFWGAIVGLALVPAIAGQLAREQRYRVIGLDTTTLGSAARMVTTAGRRFGLPTTALLLSLTSAELIAGSNGAFSYFYDRLSTGDLVGALDVVFVAAVSGGILTSLIHILSVVNRTESDSTTASPPTKLSETAWPLLAAISVISVVAIVGYLRDPLLTADQNQLLNSPSIGGPWLGTDGFGQSMVERLVIAVGPTLFGGLLPAMVATAVGVCLARIIQRSPLAIGHAFDGLIDVVWWPFPLLLPFVHLYAGNPERSEFDLTVIALTGLILLPLAVRIFDRAEPLVGTGIRTVMTTWFFLAGIGSSARILLGFMGVTNSTNGPENADLGALISTTNASAPLSAGWSVFVTAVTGVVLLSLLYWFAAAMSAPVQFKALAPADAPMADTSMTDAPMIDAPMAEQPPTEQHAVLKPTEPIRRDGPLQPQDLRTIVRPVYEDDQEGDLEGDPGSELEGELDSAAPAPATTEAPENPVRQEQDQGEDIEIDLRADARSQTPVTRRPVVNLVDERSKGSTLETPATETADNPSPDLPAEHQEAADTSAINETTGQQTSAEQTSAESAETNPDPDHDDDGVDEQTQAELDMLNATSIDLAAQASQTIELRPSTLRRAGIIAPGATPPPERGNDRPILAERAEDYERESPTDQQAEEQDEG